LNSREELFEESRLDKLSQAAERFAVERKCWRDRWRNLMQFATGPAGDDITMLALQYKGKSVPSA